MKWLSGSQDGYLYMKYAYIYIHMYVCMYACMYVYVYMHPNNTEPFEDSPGHRLGWCRGGEPVTALETRRRGRPLCLDPPPPDLPEALN